jgi:enoyl-CoA hydratase/carnithine racemase
MHTNGGPIVFTGQAHTDFTNAFYEIGRDRENYVVILTGTGDEWMAQIDFPSLGDVTNPRVWDQIYYGVARIRAPRCHNSASVRCCAFHPCIPRTNP